LITSFQDAIIINQLLNLLKSHMFGHWQNGKT